MNTTLTSARPKINRLVSLVLPETQQMLAVGRQHNWDFEVLGQAPCPAQPVRVGDWLITPIEQDSSNIPARTLERVQAIYQIGLRPKRFVLVHEAPLLLAGATQSQMVESSTSNPDRPILSPKLKSLLTATLVSSIAVGLASLAVAAIAATVVGAAVATVAVDPILVAITEDDYWIEIDRWWV